MSVHTPLSPVQVHAFLQRYGLQQTTHQPILSGIENSNWFIHGPDGQAWVLTVFEVLDLPQAQQLSRLMQILAAQGLPVAAPIAAQDGQAIQTLCGKPAQLAPRLAGVHPERPTVAQCQQMGQALAAMHQALGHVGLKRPHGRGPMWARALAEQLHPHLSAADQELLDTLFAHHDRVNAKNILLPSGLIHGDLFRDNSLFVGDRLTGLLDFSEWGTDARVLDLAITLNDFCSDWPQVQLDDTRVAAFLAGHAQIQPLEAAERQALPLYLALAAGRFWLSRLAVAHQAEDDASAQVLRKDPDEMRRMLRDRLDRLNARSDV